MMSNKPKQRSPLQEKIHTIIFEADTRAGRTFDLVLTGIIIFSVILVILESVPHIKLNYGIYFYRTEWFLTTIFLIEYFLRIYSVQKPLNYIFSFLGIIDFLSSFSTIFGLFIPGAQSFLVIRALRLLRIFRVLKLTRYFSEGMMILDALKASRIKISVFLFTVVIIILLSGTTMYIIEGPEAGFTNIPVSMYWAVVTLTTVGYGDIAPLTNLGRILASVLMIVGYAIIAVPTGIVTSELTKGTNQKTISNQACPGCGSQDHDADAVYCKECGSKLE